MRCYLCTLLFLIVKTTSSSSSSSSSTAPPHPATALLSRDLSTVYFFIPSTSSADFRFVSLHLNDTFSASNISSSFTELPSPPLSRSPQASITPLLFSNPSSIDGILDEKVVLFSGSCDDELALYEFNLSDTTAAWKSRRIVPADGLGRVDIDINSLPLPRGRYYARAFAYSISSTSSSIAPSSTFMKGQSREGDDELKQFEQGIIVTTTTESKAYMFGGQCPNESTEWSISKATYTASLLAVEFPISRTFSYHPGERKGAPAMRQSTDSFSAVISDYNGHNNKEWPIPEAGFSITTIPTGDSTMNVVMIGGHTETAFVDMRQVAVYAAPEGRWKFADVELPPASPPRLPSSSTKVATDPRPTTDTETTREDPSTRALVQRRSEDTRRIDPRSGHSAVATKDGRRVIVYGGWVGDINTPAEPRLIILELSGEAGRDVWRWDIPYIHPGELGPPADGEEEGLSGHAAVMLEGNVMMITSGYRVSPFANASVVSDKSYFFNVTSGMWAGTYKPGGILAAEEAVRNSEHRKATGIVLGVVFGIAGLAAAVIGYYWYFRKGKKGRDAEGDIYSRPLERERWGSFGFYGRASPSEERLGSFNCYGSEKPSTSMERIGIYGSRRPSVSQERLGIYRSRRPSISQERVGIVETRNHSYRVLGEETTSPSGTPERPPPHSIPYISAPVPGPRPPPKAVLKTNPARVSTIFEAEESSYDPKRGSRSSCGATTGSDDLAELYSRSLAFAEKMAAQETIYEQSRSRTGTLSDEWSDTSHHHILPRPPPRAALSTESLKLLPPAPLRIPCARSFPPTRSRLVAGPPRPKVKTLLTPTRFFPSQPPKQRCAVSTDHGAPPQKQPPKRWASISALRSALPDILPTSPISLWETRFSRNASSSSRATPETGSGSGSDTVSIPIALDSTLLGSDIRFSGIGDDDWDLEAAIEKRVVQVMFTAPRGELRVVNLDERVVPGQGEDEDGDDEEEESGKNVAAKEAEVVISEENMDFESDRVPKDLLVQVSEVLSEETMEMVCQ